MKNLKFMKNFGKFCDILGFDKVLYFFNTFLFLKICKKYATVKGEILPSTLVMEIESKYTINSKLIKLSHTRF